MKSFNALLIFAFISIVASTKICDGEISGSSYNDCKKYED